MGELSALRDRAFNEVRAHWKSCEEAGLPHTDASRDAVLAVLDGLFAGLAKISGGDDRDALASLLREAYGQLGAINAQHEDGLLETDERELLVPIVIDAVAAAGFDPEQFPDEEPGGEFRTF